MSTVAFGALATRRGKSDSGTSKWEEPPALNSYIDILAALVPAEVLAVYALVIAEVTKTTPQGQTQITDPATLRWAFWLLIGLSMALFVVGRRPVRTPAVVRQQSGGTAPRWQHLEWQDLIRLLIPPAAFVGWIMLQPTSAWNVVAPSMASGMRILIPTAGAVLLAAITKALVSHSDKKPSPPQMNVQSALRQAAQHAIAEKDQLAAELQRAQQTQQDAAKTANQAEQKAAQPQPGLPDVAQPAEEQQQPTESTMAGPSPTSNGFDARDEQPVPKWVY
jgi:hypothetical protein